MKYMYYIYTYKPMIELVVKDSGVRGLGFKYPGYILTSRTETMQFSITNGQGWW